MINLLLPLQKQQYRFGQSPSASCPSACGCPEEDWKHFLRCPHLQRKQAWTVFVPMLSSTMERWQLDPSLRRILLHMIVPLTTLPPIPLTDLADEYKMILTTQRLIGEDSLLFRFFSTAWVRLQDRYLKTLGLPSSRHEATRAVRSMILLCHEQCHSIWLLQNNHLHGTDPKNLTCYKKHLHLLAQIHELYEAVVPHMMQHDRPIFDFPFDCRKLQSTSILKAFYLHAKPIVELSIKQAAQLGSLFQPITSYFRPTILAHLFDIIFGR
jgi:hypothetical protein